MPVQIAAQIETWNRQIEVRQEEISKEQQRDAKLHESKAHTGSGGRNSPFPHTFGPTLLNASSRDSLNAQRSKSLDVDEVGGGGRDSPSCVGRGKQHALRNDFGNAQKDRPLGAGEARDVQIKNSWEEGSKDVHEHSDKLFDKVAGWRRTQRAVLSYIGMGIWKSLGVNLLKDSSPEKVREVKRY